MESSSFLPVLHPDMEILEGPLDGDGSPTYTVHDRVSGSFHQIGWAEATILLRLVKPLTLSALLAELTAHTTLRVGSDEVRLLIDRVEKNGWTRESGVRDTAVLLESSRTKSFLHAEWWLHNYLYLRIPLFRPDALLERTLPYFRRLCCRPVFAAVVFLSLLGAFFLLHHWNEYIHTFADLFTLENLVYFGMVLTAVKAVHEFAHAYAAKLLGIQISTMGVALMVLWPVAYCDVTDGWRLRNRRDRLFISAAGILAECLIGAVALFLWGMTRGMGNAGLIPALAFIFSSSALASTLLVNLNPAMRFDGYYLLMDLWGVDNLQARAFAMTRWYVRRVILGMETPPPEVVTPRRLTGMVIYSLYCWIYRLFLFIGIAVLVYYAFGKILGTVLFFVEILFFLVAPVARELREWYDLIAGKAISRRLRLSLMICGVIFLWAALPLPRRISSPAVVVARAGEDWSLYAPGNGTIMRVYGEKGRGVTAGQPLLMIDSPELELEISLLREECSALKTQVMSLLAEESTRARAPEVQDQLRRAEGVLRARMDELQANTLPSPGDGILAEWDESIHPGQSIFQGGIIGRLVGEKVMTVSAFLPEAGVEGIEAGQSVHLLPASGRKNYGGRVKLINSTPVSGIDEGGELASIIYRLPVRERVQGVALLAGNYYRVDIEMEEEFPLQAGETGEVWLWTAGQSHLLGVVRSAWNILLAEFSF